MKCMKYIQGIQTLARIAHCYQIRSAFNAIMHSLCNHLMMCLLQFGTQNQLLPTTFDSRIYTQNEHVGNPRSDSLSSIHSTDPRDIDNQYSSISVPYFLSATPRASSDDTLDDISQLFDADNDSNVLAIDIRITFTIKIFFELVKDYGMSLLSLSLS